MTWKTDPGGLKKKAQREFGEWLSAPPWEWYTTHTFKVGNLNNRESEKWGEYYRSEPDLLKNAYMSPTGADKAWYEWFGEVREMADIRDFWPEAYGEECQKPFYFRVAEYQGRGTLHYHALVGGVGDLRRLYFKDKWEKYGFARVMQYEVDKGANFYVGKYLNKTDDGDIRFSHNVARFLRGL